VLWGNREAHMHMVLASNALPESGIPSVAPTHGESGPGDDGSARKLLSAVVWARTPHGTCSPTWNGIGSDKALIQSSSSLVIKPLEEDHTPGTVKPVQVALVEPVAYHFHLIARTPNDSTAMSLYEQPAEVTNKVTRLRSCPFVCPLQSAQRRRSTLRVCGSHRGYAQGQTKQELG
jgi:hypothetical protein